MGPGTAGDSARNRILLLCLDAECMPSYICECICARRGFQLNVMPGYAHVIYRITNGFSSVVHSSCNCFHAACLQTVYYRWRLSRFILHIYIFFSIYNLYL